MKGAGLPYLEGGGVAVDRQLAGGRFGLMDLAEKSPVEDAKGFVGGKESETAAFSHDNPSRPPLNLNGISLGAGHRMQSLSADPGGGTAMPVIFVTWISRQGRDDRVTAGGEMEF
jgi:hypothetical protein